MVSDTIIVGDSMEENKEEVKVEETQKEEDIQKESRIEEKQNIEIQPEVNDLIKEKKSNKKLVAIILAIVILVIALVIFLFVKNNTNKNSSSTNKESNSAVNSSNTIDNNLDDTNTNLKEEEPNTNSNINTYPNIKEEYLDLTKTPKYEPAIYYSKPTTFIVGYINDEAVEAKIGIENKKAYLYYKDKKIKIEGINNAKIALAGEAGGCTFLNEFSVLTEEGDIYSYLMDDYPDDIKESEVISILNTISKNMKNQNLSKKYIDIEIGFRTGGNRPYGEIIGTTADSKKYFTVDSEKSINTFDVAYINEEIIVDLNGFISNYEKQKISSFKAKAIFNPFYDEYYDGYVIVSDDLYLYEWDDNGFKEVKPKTKIGKKTISKDKYFITIYFLDNSKMSFESSYIKEF